MSVTLSPLPAEEQQGEQHRWTVEAFCRAYDAGEFGYSRRFELIQGRIVEKMPPGPHHSYLADAVERNPAPENVALLVEVADTTVTYDLGEKALLYAQAGISDYWVVLVNETAIVRHREPTPDGYQEVTRLAGQDTLSPLAVPEVVWMVNALLGREEAPEEN